MKIDNVFDILSRKLKEDLENLSKLLPHSGEEGAAKEEAIKEFIRTYVPERFGVESGFVFDYTGKPSQQIDIIIYDKFVAPKFKILGNKYFFPCESVVAVGEMKTNLTKVKLLDAIEKIKSVKSLDRTAGGRNIVRIGYQFEMNKEKLEPHKNHVDNIFGFIFSINSNSLKSVTNNLRKEILKIDRQYWPNILCVLNKGIVAYYSNAKENIGLITDAYKAEGLYYSIAKEKDTTFMKWFTLMSNDICRIHFSGIPFLDYFNVKNTENEKISF